MATDLRVVGIDVAGRRPLTLAWLEGATGGFWPDTRDLVEIRVRVEEFQPEVVAIDAPCALSRELHVDVRGGREVYRGRECDHELRIRNIQLYQVPPQGSSRVGDWIKQGLALHQMFIVLGYQHPRATGALRSVLEVYPHGSFVTLLDGIPAPKRSRLGREQRVAVLEKHGVSVAGRTDHDALDALAAALTGLNFCLGEACCVGDPDEALIWLPVWVLRERYVKVPANETQLMAGARNDPSGGVRAVS